MQIPRHKRKSHNLLLSGGFTLTGILALSVLWVFWLHNILNSNGLEPHGYCFMWNRGLVALHVGSDSLIALAYIGISATLIYFVHITRNSLPFSWIFVAFGAFIVACAATHALDVWTLWNATYWLSGTVKLITALISVMTAIVLPPLLPKALILIENARTSQERKHELEDAHHELEDTHRELETLYAKSQELDQLKTRFFANISHELRTPLTLILGSIKNLAEETPSPDLQVAERNTLTLLRHVNDLLDVAKLEAGQMELNYGETDLAHLLRLSMSHFDVLAHERQIAITYNGPQLLLTQADSDKLQRVFLNLLSNAFKFTPIGGHVDCTLAQSNGQGLIRIQDSGPGIPIEQREAIFERFQRGDESIRWKFAGTGLGLAIVKEFIELHNGTITAENAPERGAIFTITLPLLTPIDSTIHYPADKAATSIPERLYIDLPDLPYYQENDLQNTQPARSLILVIEDNSEMSRFITRTLTTTYRIALAFNGQEGLKQALALQPDLILCDLMMPIMNGEQFVAQARTQAELDNIPIMILSARADDELRVQLLRKGVQDYLIKPFFPEELRIRAANLITMKLVRQILQQELTYRDKDVLHLANEAINRKHELQIMLDTLQKNAEALAQSLARERISRIEAEEAGERLKQINKLLQDFIAVVSHEFRTTLTSIQGFSELLYLRNLSPETVKDYASDIHSDALRLNRMITELLDLERMKHGKMQMHLTPIDLNTLLNTAIEHVRPTTAQHTFSLNLDATLPQIEGDSDKLLQVVTNLLSNAVKYSPSGGAITLSSSQEEQTAHICIQDQGIGIPAEALERIFDPYSRIDAETTRYVQGTGLGLTIVQQIVQMHAGKVWAESTPGNGASFHVLLPFKAISTRPLLETSQKRS